MSGKEFLNEMSTNYLFDIRLTNLEWLYIERVVLKDLRDDGILVPSKSNILRYILEKAMTGKREVKESEVNG